MPNSASGPPPGPVVCMLTARPWKQGMVTVGGVVVISISNASYAQVSGMFKETMR
jgi:hypothetical protein